MMYRIEYNFPSDDNCYPPKEEIIMVKSLLAAKRHARKISHKLGFVFIAIYDDIPGFEKCIATLGVRKNARWKTRR